MLSTIYIVNKPFFLFLCTRYVVSYAEPNYGEPQRLTQAGYSHAVTLNEVHYTSTAILRKLKELDIINKEKEIFSIMKNKIYKSESLG